MQVVWIGAQEYGFIEQQVWLAGNPPPPPPPSPPPPPGPPSPPPPPPVGIMPQLNFTATFVNITTIYQSTQILHFQQRRAHSVLPAHAALGLRSTYLRTIQRWKPPARRRLATCRSSAYGHLRRLHAPPATSIKDNASNTCAGGTSVPASGYDKGLGKT